jgi:hypothetical protein
VPRTVDGIDLDYSIDRLQWVDRMFDAFTAHMMAEED